MSGNPPLGQRPTPPILTTDRLSLTVSFLLLSVSAISWALTYYLMPFMQMDPSNSGMVMGVAFLVSSISLSSISLFELVWVVGMVAMMFPAMVPVVVFYNKVATKIESNPYVARAIGTPLFLMGYLATYAGLGLLVYFAVFFTVSASSLLPTLSSVALFAPSLVLIFTGIYQLSPLKSRCLSHCVSPLGFFAVHSQKGLLGSIRMGLSHGKYCVGCCWAYMLVMFVVAVMSLPFMAILAAVIASEKVIIRGAAWFTNTVAAGFILLGVVALFVPNMLVMPL